MLTGDEEAALAFDGAVRNLRSTPAEPVLVIDIGGGSTELILGRSAPDAAHSMDIGSVRLHERHLHSDPPTADEVAACVADIDAALDACPVDPADAATVVGVAGTILSVAAGVLDLPAYDRDAHRPVRRTRSPTSLAFVDRLVAMPVRRTARAAVDAPRPRRRDRRRRADPRRGSCAGPTSTPSSSPRPTSSTGSPGRWRSERFTPWVRLTSAGLGTGLS